MAFDGFGANATTMLEAEDVIRKWLKEVEHTDAGSSCTGYTSTPAVATTLTTREEVDYLGSLDWCDGNVADSAKSVVERLLKKDLQSLTSPSSASSLATKRSHDPRIAMEMRHKKVKERRLVRDDKHRQCMESKLLLKQAQREAEEEVKREEREAREKAAREEKLINLQVTLIRSQLKERQKASRQLALQQRSAIEKEARQGSGRRERRKQGLKDIVGTSHVVLKAEELVTSEKKRQRTRSELIKQLEEASTHETKESIKLLRRSFCAWYETMVVRRAKLGKVVAVREWKAMARAWGGWRRFVKERRVRRERDMTTREMQIQLREHQIALEHHESRLLLRVLLAWRSGVRLAGAQRRQLEEQGVHRRKMDAILQAAAAMKPGNEQRPSTPPPAHPHGPPSHHIQQVRHVTTTTTPDVLPLPGSPRRTPQPAVWKVAKQQLARLITEVDRMATETVGDVTPESTGGGGGNHGAPPLVRGPVVSGSAPLASSSGSGQAPPPRHRVLTQQREDKKPVPKAATKPVPMIGMASRSAAISERRAAREKRREDMAREKAAQLAREEEERQRAERATKEALVQQRKEERRLATQKEMERLQRLQMQKELHDKAASHHRLTLLRNTGLGPWRRFVSQCHVSRAAADQLREQLLQRMAFGVWSGQWRVVVAGKEAKARTLHRKILLRRTWRVWLKSVELGRELAELAVATHPRLLVKRAFRAWCRVSKEGRMDYWEKMARARRFRQRFLQRQVLKVWSAYIPVAKEERAKELRRAELRRKVSSWLTDFQPPPPETA